MESWDHLRPSDPVTPGCMTLADGFGPGVKARTANPHIPLGGRPAISGAIPFGSFYPEPEPEPWPRHRHRPVPVFAETEKAPPPRRAGHPIVVPPAVAAKTHADKTHADKKIALAPRKPVPQQSLPARPNSGIPAAIEERFVPGEVLCELRAGVSTQATNAIAK
jgi:hypothetical protein